MSKLLHLIRQLLPVLLTMILFLPAGSALAVTDQRRNIERYPFYDESAEQSVCSSSALNPATGPVAPTVPSAPLPGGSNVEKAYLFFVAKGLSPEQSAGIVGNLIQESGVNPASVQHGGGPGRGIAQWTVNERWATLLTWAGNKGLNPLDLNTQLEFLWVEATNGGAGSIIEGLKRETTVQGATQYFEIKFERAGIPNMAARINNAINVLNSFGGTGTPTGPYTGTDTGVGGDTGATNCADQSATATDQVLPTGDRAALAAQITSNSAITFDLASLKNDLTATVQCTGKTDPPVQVSENLLKLIINLQAATKAPLRISAIVSNHSCGTNHAQGLAVDIGNEEAANVLYPYLYNHRQLLGIDELIFSPDGVTNTSFGSHNLKHGVDFNYSSSVTSEHNNHIHVSVEQ